MSLVLLLRLGLKLTLIPFCPMKKSFIVFFFSMISVFALAQTQNETFQLSSHILDVSKGMPAGEVKIKLEKYNAAAGTWHYITEKITDKNGRVPDFLPGNDNRGIYKLTYFTSDYFKKNKAETFYPFIEVVFEITDSTHYHVPITLSAYGYSTYRGN